MEKVHDLIEQCQNQGMDCSIVLDKLKRDNENTYSTETRIQSLAKFMLWDYEDYDDEDDEDDKKYNDYITQNFPGLDPQDTLNWKHTVMDMGNLLQEIDHPDAKKYSDITLGNVFGKTPTDEESEWVNQLYKKLAE